VAGVASVAGVAALPEHAANINTDAITITNRPRRLIVGRVVLDGDRLTPSGPTIRSCSPTITCGYDPRREWVLSNVVVTL